MRGINCTALWIKALYKCTALWIKALYKCTALWIKALYKCTALWIKALYKCTALWIKALYKCSPFTIYPRVDQPVGCRPRVCPLVSCVQHTLHLLEVECVPESLYSFHSGAARGCRRGDGENWSVSGKVKRRSLFPRNTKTRRAGRGSPLGAGRRGVSSSEPGSGTGGV